MTCCSSSSSVSRSRFVTAGAIDLKLCTYVPLGEMTVQTNFRSDLPKEAILHTSVCAFVHSINYRDIRKLALRRKTPSYLDLLGKLRCN
jgi:hypothetical protein